MSLRGAIKTALDTWGFAITFALLVTFAGIVFLCYLAYSALS